MKRVMDVMIAAGALLLLLPVLALIYILVLINMGHPVFFIQQRPGLGGAPFKLIKFRTMLERQDDNNEPLLDSQRMTKLGKFLRKTSLDELPELWNVLKGDMSIIGPRPLLMDYLSLYSAEQHRRHAIKPGITGWAQVNGRNSLSWEQKFQLDVWYVDNRTLWLDIKILLLTVKQVFSMAGISEKGEATMSKFRGNQP